MECQRPRRPKQSQGRCPVALQQIFRAIANMRALNRLESQMQPASEATKVETPDGLVEYAGSGKLKDKKVLITGGE